MIVVPLLNSLEVKNYGLFPGADSSRRVVVDFTKGLSLIVGINGLGKTTLLNMLLRSLTGPYDISGVGPPESYEAVLPEKPVRLRNEVTDFFSQRVADGAQDASATLDLAFKRKRVVISRKLSNLDLIDFRVSGQSVDLPTARDERERVFQDAMTEFFNLSSFVDVLLILHNVIFFTERKTGALWDMNAQRHVLRAVFLDNELAKSVSQTARTFQTADSQFRNTRAQYTKFDKQVREAMAKEQASPHITAELEATSAALSGSVELLDQLEENLGEEDDERRQTSLVLEKAKLENESANGAVERAKYSSLLHLFPKMEDSARLLLSRILSEAECLVCGAEAIEKKAELEALILKGFCPACGADADSQKNKAPAGKFEKAKMKKARGAAQVAENELEKAAREHKEANAQYAETLTKVLTLKAEIENLKSTNDKLSSLLPGDSNQVKNLKNTVNALKSVMNTERVTLEESRAAFSKVNDRARTEIVEAAVNLSRQFGSYIQNLLSETAELTQVRGQAKIGHTTGDQFEFPAFVPQMSAADRPGMTPRVRPDDVSESQRELIDLAFRLALIEVATGRGRTTFLMETPEASLDGLAMKRVGAALKKFSDRNENRLIVTNNLTNAGMIAALFGGTVSSKKEQTLRFEKVFNLLKEAAPNQAISDDGETYQALLVQSVMGASS